MLQREGPGERRRRRAAEPLAAQESGEWQPADPGEGAAAERARDDDRRELGEP
jgi:hypothetical protein